jgi:hypothetical protein
VYTVLGGKKYIFLANKIKGRIVEKQGTSNRDEV